MDFILIVDLLLCPRDEIAKYRDLDPQTLQDLSEALITMSSFLQQQNNTDSITITI